MTLSVTPCFVVIVQIVLVLTTSCVLLVSANKGTYDYGYGVSDMNTGDVKEQQESRGHDQVVRGYYKTLDSDGLMRTVNYQAHPVTGFQAQVSRDKPGVIAPMTGPSQPIIPISPSPIMQDDSETIIAASPASADCESESITPAPIQRIVDIEPARIYPAVSVTPQPMLKIAQPSIVSGPVMEKINYVAPAWQSEKLIQAPILGAKFEPSPILRTTLNYAPAIKSGFTSTVVHEEPEKFLSPPTGLYSPTAQSYAFNRQATGTVNVIAPLAEPQYYSLPAPALPKYYSAPAPLALPKYYSVPAPLAMTKYYSASAPLALPKYYSAPAPVALPKYYSAPAPLALTKSYAPSAPLMAPMEGPKFIPVGLKTAPIIVDSAVQEPCEK